MRFEQKTGDVLKFLAENDAIYVHETDHDDDVFPGLAKAKEMGLVKISGLGYAGCINTLTRKGRVAAGVPPTLADRIYSIFFPSR